jgi:hyperosmotically inducible periplasmic protein
MLMRPLIAAAAAGLVVLAGCTPEHPTPTTARPAQGTTDQAGATSQAQASTAPAAGESPRPVGQVADDAIITGKVKAALVDVEGVKVSDVNVDTVNGTVTLKGVVDNQAQAEQAIHLAQATEGVRGVTSRLVIKTTP